MGLAASVAEMKLDVAIDEGEDGALQGGSDGGHLLDADHYLRVSDVL